MREFSSDVMAMREFLADRFLEGYRVEHDDEPEDSYEHARAVYLDLIDDIAPEFGGDAFYRRQVRRDAAHPDFRSRWLTPPAPSAGEAACRVPAAERGHA